MLLFSSRMHIRTRAPTKSGAKIQFFLQIHKKKNKKMHKNYVLLCKVDKIGCNHSPLTLSRKKYIRKKCSIWDFNLRICKKSSIFAANLRL